MQSHVTPGLVWARTNLPISQGCVLPLDALEHEVLRRRPFFLHGVPVSHPSGDVEFHVPSVDSSKHKAGTAIIVIIDCCLFKLLKCTAVG